MRPVTAYWCVTVIGLAWWAGVDAQSNYAERGVDIEYQGNGIPQEATLDGIVTKLDDLTNIIRTNRLSGAFLRILLLNYSIESIHSFSSMEQDISQFKLCFAGHGSGP